MFLYIKGDNGTNCSAPDSNNKLIPQPRTIHVSFSCDRQHGLGRPVKKLSSPCNAQFAWPTVAACSQTSSSKEVYPMSKNILSKCYTYDSNGEVRDLSPLIADDGYEVLSMPDVNSTKVSKRFFINVCSEVGKSCKNGQSGTAACSRTPGPSAAYRDVINHLGYIRKSTLHFDEVSDEVVLTYQDLNSDADRRQCTHQTHIRFKCPSNSADVNIYGLESRKPFLLSSSDCETVIEWETDHACPLHKLRGNLSNCIIEENDFTIDLSPLQKMGQIVVKNITGPTGFKKNVTHDVVLSVCGSFTSDGKICPQNGWKTNSVCINSTDGNHLIGSNRAIGPSEPELAFNDGNITLIYPTNSHKNDLCDDKEASPVTTINFNCDPSVEANVSFVSMSPTCEFNFEVRTKHACHPPHLAVPSCALEFNGTLFDLSPLRKKAHEFLWTASINPYSFKSAFAINKDERILINVCGAIPKMIKNNGTCIDVPTNSAACLYNGKSKESRNIGQFINPPVYDPINRVINMTYETTDVKNKKTISLISFKCSPGVLDSSPVLVSRTESTNVDQFNFEWKTSIACPLKTSIGTDCMVTDESLGYTFDLNPLKSDHPYIVKWGKYDFHLSVCSKLTYNPCDAKDRLAGICQRDTKTNDTYVSGQFNSNLTYFDGVIKLKYSNGTKYRDLNKTSRSAEIVFICDESNDVDMSGNPKLEHVTETDHSYFFRWYTKYACPDFENIVPCLWTNGTHSVDLSPMSLINSNHFEVTGLKRDAGAAHDKYFANVCRPLNPIRGMANCRKGSAICWESTDSNGIVSLTSLGVPSSPPNFHDGVTLSLVYPNGDPCFDHSENKTKSWSSMLNFVCDHGEGAEGSFKPIEEGNCYKKFEWRTNLVCDISPEAPHDHVPTTKVPPTKSADSEHSSKPGTAGIVIITVISFLIVLFALFIIINREAR